LPQIGQGFAVLADAFNGSGSPAATGNLDAVVRSDGIYGVCTMDASVFTMAEMASTAFAPRMPPLFAMASMGVSAVNAISRRDGIYGQKWHLWRLHRVATSPAAMASMAGHGIYGGTWHLWGPRHLQNALAQAAALTQPKWIG
jgi:hypothetical protein